MKKIELNGQEKEVASLLNDYFELGLTFEQLETPAGIKKILDLAWKEPKENLHDLGIAKFRIAKMYFRLFQDNKYIFGFIPIKRREINYHFNYEF
jgi:hypothetical protein